MYILSKFYFQIQQNTKFTLVLTVLLPEAQHGSAKMDSTLYSDLFQKRMKLDYY